jgi:hypothetical protein
MRSGNKVIWSTERVDRRDVHPNPLRVSGDIVPSGPRGFPHGTKPFVSAPTIDLVRPLSLTEELRLCQEVSGQEVSGTVADKVSTVKRIRLVDQSHHEPLTVGVFFASLVMQ